MFQWNDEDSRRRFLLRVGVQEPFAWLPQGVWRNARMSGLIMIHRPTPPLLTWRTQIAGKEEPGERLTVSGQVFSLDGQTPAQGVTV